jgi:hypothetical protein
LAVWSSVVIVGSLKQKRPHGLTTGGRETEGKVPPMGRIRKLEPEWKASHKSINELPAKRFRFLPWLKLGTSEEDYPPPESCTEEDGRYHYGEFYDLWKLGVPLDFNYPLDFRFPYSFWGKGDLALDRMTSLQMREGSALTREEREVEYDQTTMKPLLEKARQLAIRLEKKMDDLIAAEKQHPRYNSCYSPEPLLQYSHIRELAGIKEHVWHAKTWLGLHGHTKRGRRPESIRNEIVKGLRSHKLGIEEIVGVLTKLGLASAGNERERIRQLIRRQK